MRYNYTPAVGVTPLQLLFLAIFIPENSDFCEKKDNCGIGAIKNNKKIQNYLNKIDKFQNGALFFFFQIQNR